MNNDVMSQAIVDEMQRQQRQLLNDMRAMHEALFDELDMITKDQVRSKEAWEVIRSVKRKMQAFAAPQEKRIITQ